MLILSFHAVISAGSLSIIYCFMLYHHQIHHLRNSPICTVLLTFIILIISTDICISANWYPYYYYYYYLLSFFV